MRLLRITLLCGLLLNAFNPKPYAQTGGETAMAVSTGSGPFTGTTAPAKEEPATSKLDIKGYIDGYYQFGFNNATFPTSFTGRLNSFTLGMANVVFSKEGKVGFVADLGFGPRAEAANGYVGSDGGISSLSLIKQLYVTYAPVEALTLTFGNFSTFIGYELIDAPLNTHYSTSYLFSYGPFYHTGLKAQLALSDRVGLMVGLFNDTDTKLDVVKGKHFGAQVSYTEDKFSAWLNYLEGRIVESSENQPQQFGHQFDLTSSWQVTEKASLGLNASMRMFKPEGEAATNWYGTALYGKYAFSEGFTLGIRGEYLNDQDGIILGQNDNEVLAFTASGNIHIGSLTLIPEWRMDTAKEKGAFRSLGDHPLKSVSGLILAAVYSF